MNNDNTSLRKNKKEGKKLDFIPFDKRKKTLNDIKKTSTLSNNKKKNFKINVPSIVFVIIIGIILFIVSSQYNNLLLFSKRNENYNMVNNYNSVYAVVNEDGREDLFRDIGYDVVKNKKERLNDKLLETTYAYRKNGDNSDYINVYYDNNNIVTYVVVGLYYNKDDFDIVKLTKDSNAILRNFVNIKIHPKDIEKIKSSNYVSIKKRKVKISYILPKEEENYYHIEIIAE